MRVLVTGGSGRLGRVVIADLVAHGHEAVNADRVPPAQSPPGVRYIETNLGDVGQVAGAMHGCDAVIHLGAIPSPYRHADEYVFTNNTQATFAVLQAASLLGVKKAAFASSVSAYGMAWAPVHFGPAYAPIDEALPMRNFDAYGLSKEVDEETGRMFNRRDGMQVAALRFHWVALPEELATLPPAGIDVPGNKPGNLWGYVDVRDAASACRLAVEASGFGFEAFNIIAADSLSTTPTEDLIRAYLPETEIRAEMPGTTGGFVIEKAARLLGWTPRFSWRDHQK
jgi:nucleoside-diphosphate-sugar epimerase